MHGGAGDEQVFGVDALVRRRLHVKHAQGHPAEPTGELGARDDVNLGAILGQPDPAGKIRRRPALVDAGEGEERRILQEEGALLGKKQREAAEVDLAIVHLGIGEVGVEAERGGE